MNRSSFGGRKKQPISSVCVFTFATRPIKKCSRPKVLGTCALTIILPVVLYGCETWSLILRGKRKLRVPGNMVLRRIFGPRRDEVMGEIA